MRLTDFDYCLPPELIAQNPTLPRDMARLLVFAQKNKKITHSNFLHLPDFLDKNCVLVFNNTKVFPARLHLYKKTGGKVEVFLLQAEKGGVWECLLKGKVGRLAMNNEQLTMNKKQPTTTRSLSSLGMTLRFPLGMTLQPMAEILGKNKNGNWRIKFNLTGKRFDDFLLKYGETPLPPYIKTADSQKIRDNYQTIYAKNNGSVAAPTAGLHFTKRLFKKIKDKGVQIEFVTLHVGAGTFLPVKTDDIKKHQMHAEFGIIDKKTVQRLNVAKKQGKKIIAVGTTTARLLEALADENGQIEVVNDWINIFIYPGYKFKFVDSLITNFHLPKSTLLMLVSAMMPAKNNLAKINLGKEIYQVAIKEGYKFYSFGDGMMIV